MYMKIKSAQFVVSNTDPFNCPKVDMPEYAFIGRSNVGKSSLINMLVEKKGMAKTSQEPGKTQLINHFNINDAWFIVDLPGYGFAKVSKDSRNKWQHMIAAYLTSRPNLVCVFVLIDIRIEPQKIDMEFMEWLAEKEVPFEMIFTKADKLTTNQAINKVKAYQEFMLQTWEELPLHYVSSAERGTGRAEILAEIAFLNEGYGK
jgi:GTP-binding protein